MNPKLFAALTLVTVLLSSPHANAVVISGPFVDYSGGVTVPGGVSKYVIEILTGFDKKKKRYNDGLRVEIDLDKGSSLQFWGLRLPSLGGVGYLEEPDDPAGNVRITTIYGDLPTPLTDPLQMSGFDPTGWDGMSVFTDETFIGDSGTAYTGTALPFMTVADLPTAFPDFDLSVFSSADPDGLLFAFQTVMP